MSGVQAPVPERMGGRTHLPEVQIDGGLAQRLARRIAAAALAPIEPIANRY
jgi:hypothetical protein